MSVSNKDGPTIRKTPVVPVTSQVNAFQINVFCDECGTELLCSNIIMLTYPPKYPHKCPKCDKTFMLDAQYPRIEFEPNIECVEEGDG